MQAEHGKGRSSQRTQARVGESDKVTGMEAAHFGTVQYPRWQGILLNFPPRKRFAILRLIDGGVCETDKAILGSRSRSAAHSN